MCAYFSMKDLERLLAEEAATRVGAIMDDAFVNGTLLYKTEVMIVESTPAPWTTNKPDSFETEYIIAIDVALPETVADQVLVPADEVTGKMRGIDDAPLSAGKVTHEMLAAQDKRRRTSKRQKRTRK